MSTVLPLARSLSRYFSQVTKTGLSNARDKIPKTAERPVGRWSNDLSEEAKLKRAHWSSSDHCGDEICGDPKKTKELLST